MSTTIKVTELVKNVAKSVKQPELLVHLRLQQVASSMGVQWGGELDLMAATLITSQATDKFGWTK